jgi:hypothetical protein
VTLLGDFAQFAGTEEKAPEQLEQEYRRWFNVGKGFTDAQACPGEKEAGRIGEAEEKEWKRVKTRSIFASADIATDLLEKRKEVNADQFLADLDESEAELWKLLRTVLVTDIELFRTDAAEKGEEKVSNKAFIFGIIRKINPNAYKSESRAAESEAKKDEEDDQVEVEGECGQPLGDDYDEIPDDPMEGALIPEAVDLPEPITEGSPAKIDATEEEKQLKTDPIDHKDIEKASMGAIKAEESQVNNMENGTDIHAPDFSVKENHSGTVEPPNHKKNDRREMDDDFNEPSGRDHNGRRERDRPASQKYGRSNPPKRDPYSRNAPQSYRPDSFKRDFPESSRKGRGKGTEEESRRYPDRDFGNRRHENSDGPRSSRPRDTRN